MAKYRFKWWHGVLGLVGLGMVTGAVRKAKAAVPTPDDGRVEYGYRGATIVTEPSRQQPGFVAEVFAISGERLQWSVLGTRESANRWAERWVDDYIRDLGGAM